jgi:DNA damage-binding protein 1
MSSPSLALHKVAEWNRSHYVTSLVSGGNTLMVGDAISSVSLLKLNDGRLETVARDYGSLWPVCLEALDDKSVIGVNVGNHFWPCTTYLLADAE